ncbi:hypothetical protein BDB01DRAFT_6681 [Pilobolus umbonatus]|nr:hypothetical protein BDB01DRAFT_6681 [Pilobolus umbonatus]
MSQLSDSSVECIICSEKWSSRGEHKMVSLKCGHLFGEKCIRRWIRERSEKLGSKKTCCPTCMKLARFNDIRRVRALHISAVDITQSEILKKELEDIRGKTYEELHAIEKIKLAINLSKRELNKTLEHIQSIAKERSHLMKELTQEELQAVFDDDWDWQ